jgi:hypothetical protein
VISHVGVIELTLVVMGRTALVGSVHAVATHPDFRRRGHYRQLMEEVIRFSKDRFETLILSTENPEYYEPFGFRIVSEHRFTVRCESPGGAPGMRLLDIQQSKDRDLLFRLLETREPVSRIVGVVDDTVVFCFNEGTRPLWYAEDLDTVFCLEAHDRKLKLFDVLGTKVPNLAALLERFPEPIDEVTIYFAPDRLDVEATAVPYVPEHGGPSLLMARGPFAGEDQAFTLPRPART